MVTNVIYLPGAQDKLLAQRIITLWSLIRADIHRYLRYKEKLEKEEESQKIVLLIKRCKNRILWRLEKVVKIQSEHGKTNEEWEEILIQSLETLKYWHKINNDVSQKLNELIGVFRHDTTSTKVHYLQIYMKTIARISPENTIIPFQP